MQNESVNPYFTSPGGQDDFYDTYYGTCINNCNSKIGHNSSRVCTLIKQYSKNTVIIQISLLFVHAV